MAAIKTWLLARMGAYRELPQYLREIRKGGLELAYGESLIALAFAIYTFVNSIKLDSVLIFFGASFLLAGYHIWRAYNLRLTPKLGFAPLVFTEMNSALTVNTLTSYTVQHIQVLPRCLTEAPVEECQGRLLRVLKWSSDHWEPTPLNEPLDLIWSFHDSAPRTLQPEIDQRLNIIAVSMNGVDLQVEPSQKPIKTAGVFTIDEDYRFDVIVTGRACPSIRISVRMRLGANTPQGIIQRRPMPVAAGVCDDVA